MIRCGDGIMELLPIALQHPDHSIGAQLSGNKVRKLEFLMAEAVKRGHDSVITIGGIQSNHCRSFILFHIFIRACYSSR